MKTLKKISALILAFAMCFALAMPAFATSGDITTENPSTEESVAAGLQASTVNQNNGNGKITIENASKGKVYSAYQIFGATYNTGTGSVAYTINSSSPFYTAVQESGLFDLTDGATGGNYYVSLKSGKGDSDVLTWLNGIDLDDIENLKADATKTADGSAIEWTVPYGYYYVTSGLGTVISVDKNTSNPTIYDKNTVAPGKDGNTEYKTVDDAKVAVGDTATFTIQFNTVNYVSEEKVTTYTVKDTPSNLKIDTTSLTITIGSKKYTVATNDDNDVVLTNEKDDSDTVVLAATSSIANGGLNLIFNWVNDGGNNIYDNDTKVIITYQAEVMHGAADSNAKNSAEIYYNSTKFTPDSTEVELKTYDFKLTKVDGKGNKLANAKFNLQVADANGNYSNVKVVEETENGAVTGYHVADSDEIANNKYTEIIVAGEVTIKGLDLDKTYQLVETEAPVGYNKLTDPWPVLTNAEVDDEGNITTQATDFENTNVENKTGSVLPSTGGIGTTIFYVVGGVLVVAAGVLLVTKKRMGE